MIVAWIVVLTIFIGVNLYLHYKVAGHIIEMAKMIHYLMNFHHTHDPK